MHVDGCVKLHTFCWSKCTSLWIRPSIKSLNFAPLRESLFLISRRNLIKNVSVSFHELILTPPGKDTKSQTFWYRRMRTRKQNSSKGLRILIKSAAATCAPIWTHCRNYTGILITGRTDIIMHHALWWKSTRILITDCDNLRLARHFCSQSYSCLGLLPAGYEKP